MNDLYLVLIIMAGLALLVVSIIFFVKIWIMTNNVRKIKDTLNYSNTSDFEIRKCLVMGEKEKAKKMLIERFLTSVDDWNGVRFETFKKDLIEALNKIEVDVPEIINNMNSIKDFNSLF